MESRDAISFHDTFYSDNRTIFDYQRQEGKSRTHIQFGIWCSELGIDVLTTSVPQAKGRIERLWGTLQSRLVSELRINHIANIDDANRFLPGFTKRFNEKFAIEPSSPDSLFAEGPDPETLDVLLSIRHDRKADNGGFFSWNGARLMMVDGDGKIVHANPGSHLEVMLLKDGTVMCGYRRCIYHVEKAVRKEAEAPENKPEKPKAQARQKPKNNWNFWVIKPKKE